jgi:hypothetical protein
VKTQRTVDGMEILKLDESCISNPKSEISDCTAHQTVQSRILDFGFEMQDSSNFKISPCPDSVFYDRKLIRGRFLPGALRNIRTLRN